MPKLTNNEILVGAEDKQLTLTQWLKLILK